MEYFFFAFHLPSPVKNKQTKRNWDKIKRNNILKLKKKNKQKKQ